NGSGKSAIFDAMTYALYETHRGGTQNAKDLINPHEDNLVVEFDFMLGEDSYRVKRTLPRRGRPSIQAFQLQGPHAPYPNRPGPQPIPETSGKTGFDQWVSNTLGLDARTFRVSVLLEQGNSDALLAADPKDRHTVLSQLIDISAYERLHQRAEE